MSHMLPLVDVHTKVSCIHTSMGPNSFIFTYIFTEKFLVYAPYKKSWICPWLHTIYYLPLKGSFLISNSIDFWYFLILHRATVPGVVSSHHLFWELSSFLYHLYHIHIHGQELCKLQN